MTAPQALRPHIPVRYRQLPFDDDFKAKAGSRVPFAHQAMLGIPFGGEQLLPQVTVADIGVASFTTDMGCTGQIDTDVMQHGRLLDKPGIHGQLGVILHDGQGFVRHIDRVRHEDIVQPGTLM